MPPSRSEPGASRHRTTWIVLGVLVAALSLRGPIVAPTPVLRLITDDLAIGASAAGLLTSVPVLLFATLTPIAALTIRRSGPDLALLLFLTVILLGSALRALPGFGFLLGGTVLIGVGITLGNVVVPVLIRREVSPARIPLVTAAYAAALNGGSLLTSLFTAPLASTLGWPMALLSWSVVTCLALAICWFAVTRPGHAKGAASATTASTRPDETPDLTAPGPSPTSHATARNPASGRPVLRTPIMWLLAVAFSLQCTIYYGLSTWLPTIIADELGMGRSAAGAVSSIYQGVGILGALLIPALMRYTNRWVPTLTVGLATVALAVGMLAAPQYYLGWLSLGAIGHAGGFVVIFATLVAVARSDRETATMSAVVQGVGYGLAASGGPGIGLLHEWSDGWNVPLAAVLALAVGYCLTLLSAAAIATRRAG